MLEDGFGPESDAPRRRQREHGKSEVERTAEVLSWLKDQPDTFARKVHTGPMGEGGHPDIDGCQAGRAFKIEMKQPGKVPDKRQMMRLKVWRAAGALVGWAENVEHARQIMAYRGDYEWRNPLTAPGAPDREERQ